MRLQTILPAAVLLLASAVEGAHITWKKHSKTTCKDSGGDWYTATPGQCNKLYDTDHGLEIWVDDAHCDFVSYPTTNCEGSPVKRFHGRGCHSLQGNNWALRMEC